MAWNRCTNADCLKLMNRAVNFESAQLFLKVEIEKRHEENVFCCYLDGEGEVWRGLQLIWFGRHVAFLGRKFASGLLKLLLRILLLKESLDFDLDLWRKLGSRWAQQAAKTDPKVSVFLVRALERADLKDILEHKWGRKDGRKGDYLVGFRGIPPSFTFRVFQLIIFAKNTKLYCDYEGSQLEVSIAMRERNFS